MRGRACWSPAAGREGLQNPNVFQIADVAHAGGLVEIKTLGKPVDVLMKTRMSMVAA